MKKEKGYPLPFGISEKVTTQTEEGIQQEVLLENQKEITVGARTMIMFVGR